MAVLHALLARRPGGAGPQRLRPGADQARVAGRGRQEVPARAVPHARRQGPGAAGARRVRQPRQEAAPGGPDSAGVPDRLALRGHPVATGRGWATRRSSTGWRGRGRRRGVGGGRRVGRGASPGPRSCSTPRSPPRRCTRTRPSLEPGQPLARRRSCGPSSCRTRARTCSPASPGTPPRTSTGSSPWTPASSVIAEHAKALGYDGLILFMDELILWLATLIHDQKFVAREAEQDHELRGGRRRAARHPDRVVHRPSARPARAGRRGGVRRGRGRHPGHPQPGLRAVRQDHAGGPQPPAGRPRPAAQAQGRRGRGSSWTRRSRRPSEVGPQVWDTLLGSDEGDDRRGRGGVPADVSVLAGVHGHARPHLVRAAALPYRSEADGRSCSPTTATTARSGSWSRVGDLYPVIADGGDKPFTDSLKVEFEAADKLYRTKLRPVPAGHVRGHRGGRRAVPAPAREPSPTRSCANRCRTFTGDNRLMCTLLLSALAPSVPALRRPDRPAARRAQPRVGRRAHPGRRGRRHQGQGRRVGGPLPRDQGDRHRRQPRRAAGTVRRRRRLRHRQRRGQQQPRQPAGRSPGGCSPRNWASTARTVSARTSCTSCGAAPQPHRRDGLRERRRRGRAARPRV